MGERHWPGCTYRGEFGTNGLPCGKGGVVTFNGIVVKEGVFEQGCLARPLREREFTNGANGATGGGQSEEGNVFHTVAVGGRLLKQLLASPRGFQRVVAARTHDVLCYKTALHVAVECGNLGSVMLLIECGACDPLAKDYLGRTPKDCAVLYHRTQCQQLLEMLEGVVKRRGGRGYK